VISTPYSKETKIKKFPKKERQIHNYVRKQKEAKMYTKRSKLIYKVAALLTIVSIMFAALPTTAYSTTPTPTVVPTETEDKISAMATTTFTVSSTQEWQNTGVTLQAGDTYEISYVSGTWTVDYITPFPYVGPAGYSPQVDQTIPQDCKEYPSYPYALLFGGVDGSLAFPVGMGGTFVAAVSGPLFLRINDSQYCMDDNAGSVTMQIVSPGEANPPTVSWIKPVGNSQTFNASCPSTVALEVSATDDTGITRVDFRRWDAVNNIWVNLSTDTSVPYQASVDVCALNIGLNYIIAYAYDVYGNRTGEYIYIRRVDVLISFSSSTYSIGEDQGTAIITVNLSGSSGQTVAVGYTTSNGTATAGSDYGSTGGTLSFAAGQTSRTFGVSIFNDTQVEGSETVNLSLSNPVNATLGNPSNATLTIVDNDSGGWDFDLGFRPNPNGYGFNNALLLLPPYFYTSEESRSLFGDEVVCIPLLGPSKCTNKKTAEEWKSMAIPFPELYSFPDGYCDGMAVMSLRYFEQPGDYNTYALSWNDAKMLITNYQLLQSTSVAYEAIAAAKSQTPEDVINKLKVSLLAASPDPDPYVLHITPSDLTAGHTLVPYRLTDQGGGKWLIWVYDPNRHGDSSHYVMVDTTSTDTWEYTGTFGKWTGDGNPLQIEHTMSVVKISKYQAVQIGKCPWCQPAAGITPTGQVFLRGRGHLLIDDISSGGSIGYVGVQFVNQIAGAFAIPVFGSGLVPEEPTYYLPIGWNHVYNIQLDGSTLTQAEPVLLREFGPLFTAGIDTTLTPSSLNSLAIATDDGLEIFYTPNQSGQAKLILASDADPNASYGFVVGATFDSGQGLAMRDDTANHQLVFAQSTSYATYSAKLTRVDQSGEHVFYHAGIPITGDVHRLDYGTWNGSGAMTLLIDHGNGTVDTVLLDNQYSSTTHNVYLPLIVK